MTSFGLVAMGALIGWIAAWCVVMLLERDR
jgi:hypothetical protein